MHIAMIRSTATRLRVSPFLSQTRISVRAQEIIDAKITGAKKMRIIPLMKKITVSVHVFNRSGRPIGNIRNNIMQMPGEMETIKQHNSPKKNCSYHLFLF